jgi:Ca-activated chloride channel homolog
VCVVSAPPYTCRWETRNRDGGHDVRVVAQLADGTRVARAMRTAEGSPTFRATTDSVLVSVHVRDRNGRFIRGLDAKSFRILEDGAPQELLSFTSDTAASDLVLALDGSGSMLPALQELRQAATGFLQSLRPTDSVTVAAFNTSLAVLSSPSADTATKIAALAQIQPSGGTALYDTLIQAAELLKPSQGRRAIVVFTDGDDVSSRSTPAGARVALQTNDVVLYLVAQGKATSDIKLKEQLETLCEETGGRAYFTSRMSELKDRFRDIIDELTNGYVVGYRPSRPFGDGGWRTITVELADRTSRNIVTARQGYLAVRRQ